MANIKKLIHELEQSLDGHVAAVVPADTVREVIALLKAQEPSVMNIHEVHSRLLQNRIEREPFYVEVKNKFIACMVNESVMDLPDTDLREILYGKTWRCWTSRPTDEQREATPWN